MISPFKSALFIAAVMGTSVLCAPRVQAQDGHSSLVEVRTNYQLLQTRLKAAQQELDRTQALYRSGQVSQTDVSNAEDKVNQLTIDLSKVSAEMEASDFHARLRQPVNIQLDHASVQQFATALTKATRVPITVDQSVANDASAMLTLDAQQVPFADVLEAIADKTDLMISPGNNGIILKKWPHLNGRVFRSSTAPWSQEWGAPPTMSAAQGGFNPFGADANANQPEGQFQRGDGNPGMPGPAFERRFQPGGPGFAPFQMASLGSNAVVIAEPGHDRQGAPGVWMTAYRLGNGNQFVQVSSIFHPFRNDGFQGGPNPIPGGNRFPDGRGGSLAPGAGPLQPRFQPGQPPRSGNKSPKGNFDNKPGSPDKPDVGNFQPGGSPNPKTGLPPGTEKPSPQPGKALPGSDKPSTRPGDALPGAEQAPKPSADQPKNAPQQDKPLLEAIQHNDTATVLSLLKQGADPNVRLPHDSTVKDKSQQIRRGDELTALVIAIDSNRDSEPLVRALLDKGANPNLRFNEGGAPLMEAACRGNSAIIQALLDRGADINAKANDGGTALMYAARFGQENAARLLLEHGANINAQRDGGTTALMDAISFGDYVSVVKTLLQVKGIDINAQDNAGYTALDVANKYFRTEMIALLKKAGAKQNKPTPKPDTRQLFGGRLAER